MSQRKLLNKKIIISAAADGIGWSIAQECMLNGGIVYLSDKNNESLNEISKHDLYGKQLFLDKVNANDAREVENYFNKIKQNVDSIDALINNVGIAGPTGGSVDKPVGLVYIGIKYKKNNFIIKKNYFGTRKQIQNKTVQDIFKKIDTLI